MPGRVCLALVRRAGRSIPLRLSGVVETVTSSSPAAEQVTLMSVGLVSPLMTKLFVVGSICEVISRPS